MADEKKNVTVSVILDAATNEKLRKMAEVDRRSVSNAIAVAVDEWIKRKEKAEKKSSK